MPQVPLLSGLASDDLSSWLSRTEFVGSHIPRALWKLSGHPRSCSPSPVVCWGWSHEKERLSKGYRRVSGMGEAGVPEAAWGKNVHPCDAQPGRSLAPWNPIQIRCGERAGAQCDIYACAAGARLPLARGQRPQGGGENRDPGSPSFTRK